MATHPWIIVLNKDRDDPTGIAVEVYDHAHPPLRPQNILAVEALPPSVEAR
jgi:hypothetical protein